MKHIYKAKISSYNIEETYMFDIQWKVQKQVLKGLQNGNGSKLSSDFCTKFYDSTWYLQLRTNPAFQGYYGIFLFLKNNTADIAFDFTYSLKSGETELIPFTEFSKEHKGPEGYGWNKWMKQDELLADSYWPTDILTIIIRVRAKVTKVEVPPDEARKILKSYENFKTDEDAEKLSKDYATLAESQIHSDITLVVGDKAFKAHKAILATRCQFFAAMFGSNFKESEENEVNIKDIDPEDFEYLLKFIYSGQHMDKPTSNMIRLLKAAHLLDLESVVLECEKYLAQNVTVNNCLEMFEFAETYHCTNLKEKVKEFMKANTKEVLTTEAWEKFKIENSSLMCQLFEFVYRD